MIILDFEFLIAAPHTPRQSVGRCCVKPHWGALKQVVYIIFAVFGFFAAALWSWFAVHSTWSGAGSSSSMAEEATWSLDPNDCHFGRFHCMSIVTSACAVLGLMYATITCCQNWESTQRVILVLVAPGGWTTVSFILAGAMVVSWSNAAQQWNMGGTFIAAIFTLLWVVAEVALPEKFPEHPDGEDPKGWKAWWVLVDKLPHNDQEMMPYLHVLSPQEDDKITAPHADELAEYASMFDSRLMAAVGDVGEQVQMRVAGLLRPQMQELAQELEHTAKQHEQNLIRDLN
eukprot:COSAG02_NODE_5429_length_4336_cov_5155.868539_1_plen_286_part_10